MANVIKFRVYDKDYKKIHICGEDVHDSITFLDQEAHYYNLQNGEGSGEHGSYELMQYSGLKDKNGQEIYEGDLIRSNSMHKNNVFEVIYGRSSFEFIRETGSRYRADQLLWDDIEIVGNIHETGRTRKLDILYQEHQHLKDDLNLPF